MECSLPGSSVHEILQARILEWTAIIEPVSLTSPALAGRFFTTRTTWEAHLGAMKVKVKVKSLSRVRLLVTPWTVASQAPLSMEFSRQEYWSGLPFPSPSL